jgi:3-deoxy-D-manno-octulosonic-acid transferase
LRRPEADIALDRYPGGLLGEAALMLYGAAGWAALPAAAAVLEWRARQGKEDKSRRGERFGLSGIGRPSGSLIWVHAASVGETAAVAPLVERLRAGGPKLLLTTGTVTAADVASRRLRGATHQFAPLDTPATVRRFLAHWRPDIALLAESELWPTTLKAVAQVAVPVVVISARMSERSFRAWHTFPPLARAVLGRVELFLAQSLSDAERLRRLGARDVRVCGNLKFDVPPPPADEAELGRLRSEIAGRPVLVAASTHPGEEAIVIAAHAALSRNGARVLTVLAPRHPQRGEALAAEVAAAGLTTTRRSLGERIGEATDIYLADTIGEMGLWYRAADVAFLGGSLVPHGGQNPIEPAKLLLPILHGEHVGNFRDVYDALTAANAVRAVRDAPSLAAVAGRLIDNPPERERLAREARACIERFTGALDRTLQSLQPYLASLTARPNLDEPVART